MITIYKYRRRMSYGVSKWKYKVFEDSTPKEVRYYFENLDSDYQSEQHRGFDWFKVKFLPKDVYENKVLDAVKNVKYAKSWLKVIRSAPHSNKNQVHRKGTY